MPPLHLVSGLQHSSFSIQLGESTFGSSDILMAYVRKKKIQIMCWIYINQLWKLQEDFKFRFNDLNEMNVPDWI